MKQIKFKNTEVGAIPEDWEAAPLSSIGDVKMCKRILKEQTSTTGDVPFYKIGTFGKEPDAFIPRPLYEQFKSLYPYPKKGTILISAAGTIGRTVVFDGKDAYFQDSNIVWIDHNENKVKNSYLEHYFKVINWKSENGGTISRLYNDNLKSTFFCYPRNKDEQSCIATALSDVDELIAMLKKLIEKKRNIKQGAMQELLSGKRRLPGFADDWIEIAFKDIYKYASEGGTPDTSKFEYYNRGDIPFVKIEDTACKYIDSVKSYITQTGLNNSSAWLVPQNNILFTNGATVGNVAINRIPVSTKQGILGVILKENYDLEFVYYILSHSPFQKEVHNRESGGTFATIILKNLDSIPLIVPKTKEEQSAIAHVLADMDSEISILESRLIKYQSLKQGMMQQLLTGKIRLI